MEKRLVEIKNGDSWEVTEFKELCDGVVFRMFEFTGEPVIDNQGVSVFTAIGDAYMNEHSVWTINVEQDLI